jgi:hypothetical protein
MHRDDASQPYDLDVLSHMSCTLLLAVAVLMTPTEGQSWHEGPGIRADIDGDRAPDRLVLTREANHFTLRVATRHGTTTRIVRGFSGFKASALGLPSIVALRPLNARRGLEIEVRVWRGAANDFLVFFTMHRGRLVMMTGAPPRSSDTRVWDIGGGAGVGYETADCTAPHTIGLSGYYPLSSRRWVSTAAHYDVRETRFVRTASYRRVTEAPLTLDPKGWPHLKNRDFKSCGGIVVDRKAR